MIFNTADVATFRRKLGGGFYRRWRAELGDAAWKLLESETGPLG